MPLFVTCECVLRSRRRPLASLVLRGIMRRPPANPWHLPGLPSPASATWGQTDGWPQAVSGATGATFHSHRCHISQPDAPHFTAAGATCHNRGRHISQPRAPHLTAAGATLHTATSAGATFHNHTRHISLPQEPHFTATSATFHSRGRHISQTQAQAPHFTTPGATFHRRRRHMRRFYQLASRCNGKHSGL